MEGSKRTAVGQGFTDLIFLLPPTEDGFVQIAAWRVSGGRQSDKGSQSSFFFCLLPKVALYRQPRGGSQVNGQGFTDLIFLLPPTEDGFKQTAAWRVSGEQQSDKGSRTSFFFCLLLKMALCRQPRGEFQVNGSRTRVHRTRFPFASYRGWLCADSRVEGFR